MTRLLKNITYVCRRPAGQLKSGPSPSWPDATASEQKLWQGFRKAAAMQHEFTACGSLVAGHKLTEALTKICGGNQIAPPPPGAHLSCHATFSNIWYQHGLDKHASPASSSPVQSAQEIAPTKGLSLEGCVL